MKFSRFFFPLTTQKSKYIRSGFSLAEVVVALFIVSLVIILIGGLSNQVSFLSRSSRQISSVLELRNKINALYKNPKTFLAAMQSQGVAGVGYAACLRTDGNVFSCPPTNPTILDNEEIAFKNLATGMNVIDSPIVDNSGQKIAGTIQAPLYLDTDGRPCTAPNAATTCALKSTGYFMRRGLATNDDPEYVKFVVKVEKNVGAASKNTPFKSQYMSIDIGEEWKRFSTSLLDCSTGLVKVGVLSNGEPQCINPTSTCGANQVQFGVNSVGQPNCYDSQTCTAPTPFAIMNAAGNSVVCAASSECTSGVFAGYYSGTGNPMCLSENPTCTGKIQIGQVAGTPTCADVDTCTQAAPNLSFNGTKFVCQSDNSVGIPAKNCQQNYYVSGIEASGEPICSPLSLPTLFSGASCANQDEVMYGLTAAGVAMCRTVASTNTTVTTPPTVVTTPPSEVTTTTVQPIPPYDIVRSISGNARANTKITIDCGQTYTAKITAFVKTSPGHGLPFQSKIYSGHRVVFECGPAHQASPCAANVTVTCTPR